MSLGPVSPSGAPTSNGAASPTPVADVGLRRLQPVATLELAGERLDIAKNGRFHLVRISVDDYGNPIARSLNIQEWLHNDDITAVSQKQIQALLDALGEALVKLQGQRDLRLGREGVEP